MRPCHRPAHKVILLTASQRQDQDSHLLFLDNSLFLSQPIFTLCVYFKYINSVLTCEHYSLVGKKILEISQVLYK